MTADRFYTDAPITLLETLWRPMKSSKGLGNIACGKVYIGYCLVEEPHMDEAAYVALSASGKIAGVAGRRRGQIPVQPRCWDGRSGLLTGR